jgi:hypothetical protein
MAIFIVGRESVRCAQHQCTVRGSDRANFGRGTPRLLIQNLAKLANARLSQLRARADARNSAASANGGDRHPTRSVRARQARANVHGAV